MRPYLAILGVLLVVSAMIGVACGEGGGIPLDDYFRQLDAASKDADTQIKALALEDVEGSDGFTEEEAQALRDSYNKAAPIYREVLDAVAVIDEPSKVRDAHGDFVGAFGEAVEQFEVGGKEQSPIETIWQELLVADGSVQRMHVACLRLQAIAQESGINVDLGSFGVSGLCNV